MKAYIGIKYYQDYRNKLIIEEISSVLESKGFETICLARDIDTKDLIISSSQMLMKLTFEKIEDCDLVVIDLSEKGVGLGIEAGYAFAKGIPILTIAKRGSEISETLEGISKEIIFYESIGDLENIDFFEV
ncbi:MAG: nucleoside 2-deoxyribosyltransferase [Tissierella sp.]|nr:nucleoside 2-deoxyribosyltransferase [Tissierella sp.]